MKNRTGSALLIVLGILAIMIVSAVGFSAYMRYARLPSSFLRRSSASRQLAKAALAKAIDIVDRSIGNAPHPNVGASGNPDYENNWRGRVYVGTSTGGTVEEEDTVPVLTLEGLAYIPPSLINEARYYSRHSAAAMWQQFDDFEVGRYAFCAIDVSDYLDVNRMFAGYARNSSPERRITLAHLFEDADHSSAGSGGTAWDNFMASYRDFDTEDFSLDFRSKLPLVSLADFNLALGSQGRIGNMYSPFYAYVDRGTASVYGGGGSSVTAASYGIPRRMTFVTDGYFPENNWELSLATGATTGSRRYDLSKSSNQPFLLDAGGADGASSVGVTLEEFVNPSTELAQFLRRRISSLGLAALHDYLDMDSVPVSLAIPTVERTPMICGIQPVFQTTQITPVLEWAQGGDPQSTSYQGLPKATAGPGDLEYCVMNGGPVGVPSPSDPQTRKVCRTIRCRLDGLQQMLSDVGVKTVIAYPFAHEDDQSGTSFSVDGRIAAFFTIDGAPVATRAGNLGQARANRWGLTQADFPTRNDVVQGVVSAALASRGYSVPSSVDAQTDVIDDSISLVSRGAMSLDLTNNNPFLYYTREWDQEYRTDPATGMGSWVDLGGVNQNTAPIVEIRCGVPPLDQSGDPDPNNTFTVCANNVTDYSGVNVKLNLAVWVRITDGNNNVVYDMVPASVQDDAEFNNVVAGGPRGSTVGENTLPLMRLETGVVFPLDPNAIETGGATLQQQVQLPNNHISLMVVDPRFNYAPESWFWTDLELTAQNWFGAIQDTLNSADGDIFMSVSDQGYMQSVYELAFMPRFSDLIDAGADGSSLRGNCNRAGNGGIADFVNNPALTLNYHMMWRTYDPLDPAESAQMRAMNIVNGTHGQKINPYSDSAEVLMAAFANTPVDWRCASTNNVESLEQMDVSEFNSRYAWNGYSTIQNQRLAYEDLAGDLEEGTIGFVGSFTNRVRQVGNWQTAWDDLWLADTGEPDQLCGVPLDNSSAAIWEVDRKFLYGFWRECFAVRQQLFLVFVRAEPLMIGGEGINQASPQLSSRAVALVWRDPAPNMVEANGYPHRTRILFYRPLE